MLRGRAGLDDWSNILGHTDFVIIEWVHQGQTANSQRRLNFTLNHSFILGALNLIPLGQQLSLPCQKLTSLAVKTISQSSEDAIDLWQNCSLHM